MFVQVIEGRTSDRASLRRQLERWLSDLRPGAIGFLGSTAGIADDGHAVIVARFDSPEAARSNADRPEQTGWWSDTEKCFDEVTFADSTDIDTFLAGGSDEAGFVQVMKGSGADRDQVRAMDQLFEQHAAEWRPDLLGGHRVWTGPGTYIEVAYFTNEAEARQNEQKEPPAALAEHLEEFERMMAGVEFIDLREPLFTSA
jgi:hypothetical protein